MVDIPVDMSSVVLLGFPIPWGAIDADIENSASMEGWERRLYDGGFSNSLRRALGLRVWIFLQDGVEGFFGTLADLQHIDSRRELVGDQVGERIDVSNLVS